MGPDATRGHGGVPSDSKIREIAAEEFVEELGRTAPPQFAVTRQSRAGDPQVVVVDAASLSGLVPVLALTFLPARVTLQVYESMGHVGCSHHYEYEDPCSFDRISEAVPLLLTRWRAEAARPDSAERVSDALARLLPGG